MSHREVIDKIIAFLIGIGIPVEEKELDDTCFLPGLAILKGTILIDYSRLKYPGDILHEAGHIAVSLPEERKVIGTAKASPEWPNDGNEIVTLLWSYAALKHIGLPPQVVFHPNGYKNDSEWLIEQFENEKNYIGLPYLAWMGICHRSEETNQPQFPKLIKWLRS